MGRRRVSEADKQFRDEVVAKFQDAMTRHKLESFAAAARTLGITRQAFSQYMAKNSTPQGEILARACAAWGIVLKFRGMEVGRNAFRVKEAPLEALPGQLDLFKRPQIVENEHVAVRLERSRVSTLHVTIRMKKADTPGNRASRLVS